MKQGQGKLLILFAIGLCFGFEVGKAIKNQFIGWHSEDQNLLSGITLPKSSHSTATSPLKNTTGIGGAL
jgi:hypothetical protein